MSGISKNAAIDGPTKNSPPPKFTGELNVHYISYGSEKESSYLPAIRQLISKDLSEPYSIYVYRYFLYQWGDLCFMALDDDRNALLGVIVCKLEPHRGGPLRGYIAMLATRSEYRGRGIATKLVRLAVEKMIEKDADEVALETEVTNTPSLRIYENLGFLRTKRLHRYYLNGSTAFRLLLYLKPGIPFKPTFPPEFPAGYGEDHGQISQDGPGSGDEQQIERQVARMGIEEDVYGERFDITGQ
ncbi:N-alpha-acetyltransferase 30 [Friedmanniomyces endolithicus]|nr:N-alpha-acetyltransferase 30 [Friedmanniomyces endolithicus]